MNFNAHTDGVHSVKVLEIIAILHNGITHPIFAVAKWSINTYIILKNCNTFHKLCKHIKIDKITKLYNSLTSSFGMSVPPSAWFEPVSLYNFVSKYVKCNLSNLALNKNFEGDTSMTRQMSWQELDLVIFQLL